jgi:hypothetical protein
MENNCRFYHTLGSFTKKQKEKGTFTELKFCHFHSHGEEKVPCDHMEKPVFCPDYATPEEKLSSYH